MSFKIPLFKPRYLLYSITQRVVWIVTKLCMKCFARSYVYGREHIKNISTPLLIIANHRSYWDPMIIGAIFPFFSMKYLPIGFMAADHLYNNIIYRLFFFLTGTFKARRGEGLDLSLAYPRYYLTKGMVFLIFPYGKISISELGIDKPQRGIAILAKELNDLTILPVYLKTAPDMNLLYFFSRKYEMGVMVGKPFKLDYEMNQLSIEEIATRLTNQINLLNNSNERAG